MFKCQNRIYINKLLIIFLLCLISFSIYLPTLGFDFLNYDDHVYIKYLSDNFSDGVSKNNLRGLILDFVNANWHPVTILSFLLDYQIGGSQIATTFHFQNILLHTLNTILVFLLLSKLTSSLWRSALVAVLFCIHPINVESVAWISERKGLLSAVFWFLTVILYINYSQSRNRKFLFLSLIFYALSLLSKPIGLPLPFILILIDYWPLQRLKDGSTINDIIPLIIEKIPYIVLAVAIGTISAIAQYDQGALKSTTYVPIYLRTFNVIVTYNLYILKTIAPYNLSPFYPRPTAYSLYLVTLGFVFISSITYIVWQVKKWNPYLFVGWLWYLICLVPVSGIVSIGEHEMANRYAYIPTIGLFVIVVWGISNLAKKLRLNLYMLTIPAALILVFYITISRQHIYIWENSYNLWHYSYTHTEKNYVSGYYLAHALFYQGRQNESLALFYDLLRIGDKHGSVNAINKYISILISHNLILEARTILYWAIENNIRHYSIYRELGLLEMTQFMNEDIGLNLVYEALELNDVDARSHHILGAYFTSKGQYSKARKHLYTALDIENDSAKIHHSLSILMLKIGHVKEAEMYENLAEKYRANDKIKNNNIENIEPYKP